MNSWKGKIKTGTTGRKFRPKVKVLVLTLQIFFADSSKFYSCFKWKMIFPIIFLFLFVLSNLCCSKKTWVGFLGCQVIYVTWRKLYNNLIIWKIWILTQIYQQCLNCIGTRTFEFWPNFKVNKGRSRELKHTNTVSIIGLLSFISCTLDGV